jgi:ATP-binding cassette subfamily B protein
LVFQTLFDESIEDNIRFSAPRASHEQVIAAAKLADAHEFIMQFPMGEFCNIAKGLAAKHCFTHENVFKAMTLSSGKVPHLFLEEKSSASPSHGHL